MSDERIFDREGLLERAMGDTDLMGQILALFKDDSASQLKRITQLVDSGDIEELARAAHQLKGASLNVGANALAAAALGMEQAARDGSADDAPGHLRELVARHAELLRALHEGAGS